MKIEIRDNPTDDQIEYAVRFIRKIQVGGIATIMFFAGFIVYVLFNESNSTTMVFVISSSILFILLTGYLLYISYKITKSYDEIIQRREDRLNKWRSDTKV